MVMPRKAEVRCVWTGRYDDEWNVYLYEEGDYMKSSTRQDRQMAEPIGSVDLKPQDRGGRGSAELVFIWVTPQYRRQQLGRMMLADVIGWCRERAYGRIYGEILNETEANYKGLKRFYEGAGFEVSLKKERSERLGTFNAKIELILEDV